VRTYNKTCMGNEAYALTFDYTCVIRCIVYFSDAARRDKVFYIDFVAQTTLLFEIVIRTC